MLGDPCCCFPLYAKCFLFILFPLFAHLVLTCVPLIEFGSMQQSTCLRALLDLKPRENEANPMGEVESGDLKNWTQFRITPNQASEEHVVIAVL